MVYESNGPNDKQFIKIIKELLSIVEKLIICFFLKNQIWKHALGLSEIQYLS